MRRTQQVRAIITEFSAGHPGRSVAIASDIGGLGELGIGADIPRPAASVIKVAVVMALFDLAAAGRLDLDEQVPLSTLDDTRYCSVLKAFDIDRSLSLREIAALSLITSDNPATIMVMSRVATSDVERVLQAAGCGPDAAIAAGFSDAELGEPNRVNRLTARDAVRLFQLLDAEPRYRPIVTSLENNLRNARIPALLPDDAVIAHKTGSLEGVVNDAGIVSRDASSFTVAFMCDHQADPIATQTDIAASALALFDALVAEPADRS